MIHSWVRFVERGPDASAVRQQYGRAKWVYQACPITRIDQNWMGSTKQFDAEFLELEQYYYPIHMHAVGRAVHWHCCRSTFASHLKLETRSKIPPEHASAISASEPPAKSANPEFPL
jgi:hypothetical protein